MCWTRRPRKGWKDKVQGGGRQTRVGVLARLADPRWPARRAPPGVRIIDGLLGRWSIV